MKVVMLAMIASAGLVTGAAQAQELWRGAGVGMTPDAVRKAFPAAQTTPDPARTASFGTLLVTIPEVDVFGHRGRADFYFDGDRLTTVRLIVEPQDLTQQSNRLVVEKIQAELGRSPECVLGMLCSWRLPTRTVAFSAGRPQPGRYLMVEYTGPSAARAR
jgi:hypothetical protein